MRMSIGGSMDEVNKYLKRKAARLKKEKQILLKRLGLQVLSNAQLDYRTKGRGGTGTDGITWDKLKPSTLAAKARKGSKLSGTAAKKTAAAVAAAKTKRKSKNRSATIRAGNKQLKAFAAGEIGVDSGLQRASATPGFTAADGKGGNILEIEDNAVTVGYGREYSQYFDEKRELLPEVLPEKWQKDLEDIAHDWAEEIMKGDQ